MGMTTFYYRIDVTLLMVICMNIKLWEMSYLARKLHMMLRV